MYSTSIAHNLARRKREFNTVAPMRAATIERRNPRPQPIVCRGCKGTRRLEYVNPDTGKMESMPCIFCAESGVQFRNASHAEHRSLVERLAGWTWKALMAVLL